MLERLIDDVLEEVWFLEEQSGKEGPLPQPSGILGRRRGARAALERAVEQGLLKVEGDGILFTPEGRERARGVVRRHRLAERLLHDVLALTSEEMESTACHFEHILSPEATNSICILLGHPTSCPHGKPIPEGECCRKGITDVRPLVIPASRLRVGEEAEVAYIGTRERERLDRLASLGLLPGNKITLEQRQPAFVIRVDETELGLDDAIMKEIYVRPVSRR